MKILVTGAGGLLGGRIIDFLSKNGHEIVAISRSFGGDPNWGSSVQVVNLDINQRTEVNQYLKDVSVVVHTAGMNSKDSIEDPSSALYFNGVVTSNLLKAAINSSVKQFIYISTVHIYSSNLNGIIEESSCTKNLHPYASSHKAGEDTVLFANQEKMIQGTVLRLSNAFGYPINVKANCWTLLVNDLCRQAITNGNLKLNTLGNQFRNFISISEVCKVIDFIIENEPKKSISPLINVASSQAITILDMAKLVQFRAESLLGYSIPLIIPNGTREEQFESFEIKSRSLDQLNYVVSNDLMAEIDTLLKYCKDMFK